MQTTGDSETDSMAWYFSGIRMVVTIPVMLLVGVNVVYHFVMVLLLQIDLFIGNMCLWLFFGQLLGFGLGGLAVAISWTPLLLLPVLWESPRLWGVAKVALFTVGLVVSTALAGTVSAIALTILGVFVELRTTAWWAKLWGVLS